MLLMIVFLTLTQKQNHYSRLGPALSPDSEDVLLSSELCPSTGSLPGVYQEQEEKGQCLDSHSPDSGSSMGYASGGSSPEQAHEGQNPNYKEKPKE